MYDIIDKFKEAPVSSICKQEFLYDEGAFRLVEPSCHQRHLRPILRQYGNDPAGLTVVGLPDHYTFMLIYHP